MEDRVREFSEMLRGASRFGGLASGERTPMLRLDCFGGSPTQRGASVTFPRDSWRQPRLLHLGHSSPMVAHRYSATYDSEQAAAHATFSPAMQL